MFILNYTIFFLSGNLPDLRPSLLSGEFPPVAALFPFSGESIPFIPGALSGPGLDFSVLLLYSIE